MSQSRTHVELYVTVPVYSVKISGLCRLNDADSGEGTGRYEYRPLRENGPFILPSISCLSLNLYVNTRRVFYDPRGPLS